LAPTDNEIAGNNEQACIRCSACADACPASLLPQQLFWHAKAKELDKAQDYNLFDCIECGACAYVCPSEIPLVHYYRIAKSEIRIEQEDKQKSDKARDRFEKREARLIAEQQARDEKHRLAAEARKQAMATNGNNSKDKIAAALARAKAKKQALSDVDNKTIETAELAPVNTPEQSAKADVTEPSTKVASSNQRVQAAIARAKAKKAAAEVTDINPELQDKDDASDLKDNKLAQPQQGTDVKKQPSKVSKSTKTVVTDSVPKAVVAPLNEKPTIADNKQAKIAAAVAKAKAKREAQKAANSQVTAEPESAVKVDNIKTDGSDELVKTEEQQIDMKKRKIAAAVAKAKAKKAAEKADKSS
jgi:electron transport complex protein RnfC